jgi:hypothetical protein
MRTPHKGTFWEELSRYFGKKMRGDGENAGTGHKLPSIRHDQELGNTERQNSSMSVTVCRRSSAQDFLRDANFPVFIFPR